MNNNKVYKKWTLGLVAPTLVLAPIAVVASCSSSTTESTAKKATTAKSEVTIKTLLPEIPENTTSNVVKEEFDNLNDNQKQEKVFDNVAKLLEGDHEVKQANQIISPTLTDVADDETKLTLSFKLAANTWYGSDGKLGTTESNDFTITITEFSTNQPKPTGNQTVAKTTPVDVTTLNTAIEDVTAENFKQIDETTLKQLIADKKALLFDGDNNIKGESDIESATLEDVSGQNTQLNLKVKLKAEKWYDVDGNLGKTESEEFEITLTNFKAPSTTPGGKN